MRTVLKVAGKEFRDDLRNRWTLGVAVVFAALALGITYFGGVTSGRIGFTSFAAVLASLTTLAAFVIPLIGLLIAYDTVVGERDGGTLLLLLSYPLSPTELAAGKFLGHSAALAVAVFAGTGLALGIGQLATPAFRSPTAWIDIGNFLLTASLLGTSFVGLACLVSTLAREKSAAAGLALLVWFLFVVLFDLALLAVLVFSGGNAIERSVFPCLLLADPVDVFRLANLIGLGHGGGNAVFLSMTADQTYPLWVLYSAAVAWAAVPFGVALRVFRRQEI